MSIYKCIIVVSTTLLYHMCGGWFADGWLALLYVELGLGDVYLQIQIVSGSWDKHFTFPGEKICVFTIISVRRLSIDQCVIISYQVSSHK